MAPASEHDPRSTQVDDDAGAWFDAARFGMFIHVGHANAKGWELSWPLVGGVGSLPAAPRVAFEDWYTDVDSYQPAPDATADWCRSAADAGMGYAVMVTQHHDGVANFASDLPGRALSGGRDLVAEFCESARANGLRIGLYLSLSDWGHPDYPAWDPSMAPYNFIAYPRPDAVTWQRFVEQLAARITHLLTAYGQIDMIWFDGGWERSPDEWHAAELEALIRSLQPSIMINDRLPGAHADFQTPEQLIPAEPPEGRFETCMTMNLSWGWVPEDDRYTTATETIHLLGEIAGRGGNLLLNIGPGPDGHIVAEQRNILDEVTEWMAAHSSAIVGTRPGFEPWQWHGPSTCSPGPDGLELVHLICVMRPYRHVVVRGVHPRRLRSATVMGTGATLSWTTRVSAIDEVFGGDPIGEIVLEIDEADIDPHATVFTLSFEGSP